jgi:hypothetical protein
MRMYGVERRAMSFALNVLAIAPELLWRDYRWYLSMHGVNQREAFSKAFWFHASGAHRRICGYSRL